MIDYQLLFRGVPAALLVIDADLVIVEASDAYLAATMTERDGVVGQHIFAAFPDNPDDPEANGVAALEASLLRVRNGRAADVMPVQKYDVAQPGGGFATRYWAPVNVPVLDAAGELELIVHRVEDVTAYMRTEPSGGELDRLTEELRRRIGQAEADVLARRQLRRQHETLQALADGLDTAVIGCDSLGRPVLSNEAARAITGDRLDGAHAGEWPHRLHLYDPAGRPLSDAANPLLGALHGEHVRDAEVVLRPPGGPARTFRMHARPVEPGTGIVAVVALHDVTAHRRAARLNECELEVSKVIAGSEPTDDVLIRVVELIGSAIGWAASEFWMVDEVGRVLRRTACWARGDARPASLPDDPLPLGEGLAGEAWQSSRPVWATGLGEERGPLRAALAVPVPSGADVLGVLVCYSDTAEVPDDTRTAVLAGIGAQIGASLERRRAGSLAAELDQVRTEYVALVGHEVRTPLTSIQAYTDLLIGEPGLDGEQRDMLEVIHRNAGVLSIIVGKLLDVAGLRTGHLEVHRRAMDLSPVVLEAVEAARHRAHRDVTIDVNAPGATPVHGDPERLRQVVEELLNNAVIWAPEHSTIGVSLTADPHAVVLSVSNTGESISADDRARLFDLFYRGGAARHSGRPGFGLGLTLARAVVEQHGGLITVSDPEEAVTVFSVRLPACPN
ncbi:ATP-binding protein [Actinoplanes sp. NPDC049596]|uniref:PAS domain-containing sensor histidine kinase n=1 Tax=unclassified Actinoplanes TaxID=2626549 RepID=UPI00343745E3